MSHKPSHGHGKPPGTPGQGPPGFRDSPPVKTRKLQGVLMNSNGMRRECFGVLFPEGCCMCPKDVIK
ncbi:MAG: hypothetical protein KOO60_10930 [Gemmatimonadales bacterium]|nr:hypothetical protein [Gemmatimonadales bacterium]